MQLHISMYIYICAYTYFEYKWVCLKIEYPNVCIVCSWAHSMASLSSPVFLLHQLAVRSICPKQNGQKIH